MKQCMAAFLAIVICFSQGMGIPDIIKDYSIESSADKQESRGADKSFLELLEVDTTDNEQ